jgi:putative ABC transport system permease protein
VKGVTEAYFRAREWAVAEGRGIETADLERAAKVVLLGATLRATLFPDADPVGAVIRVRDVPFTVIGVLERKGQSLQGDDQDDIAFAPLTTVRRQLVGVNRASPRAIYYMLAKFADDVEVSGLLDEMRRVLRQRHRIAAGQEDSFALSNLAEVAEKQAAARRVLGVLLAAIASISLVVGGIGVMNVMLVSVTERTREIGLRMAVGAQRRDILLQFLTEAATLAGLGGVVGTLSGVLAAAMIAAIAGWPVLVDPATVLLAVASSAAIGVFFGWYPARKAARLAPIEALRHE